MSVEHRRRNQPIMIEEEERFFASRRTQERVEQTSAAPGRGLVRTLLLVGFLLVDYVRSGRIWIEAGASAAFYLVFLRGQVDAEKFFSLNGVFTALLTLYTLTVMMGIGDRPQGYLLLARRVGRTGYLLALYLAGVLVVWSFYSIVSLLTMVFSQVGDMSLLGWLLGTLPLLLNVALLAALLLMLSPLSFSTGWRLFVLALIALAFSGKWDMFGNATLDTFPAVLRNIIEALQTILGWPIVPAFRGFALSVSRDYSGTAPIVLVAQLSLTITLLGLSIYAFLRRELLLSAD